MRREKFQKPKVQIVDEPNEILQILKSYYFKDTVEYIQFEIPLLPPSANKMYDKSVRKNSRTGKHNVMVEQSAPVIRFKNAVKSYFIKNSISYNPKGILAVVIEFYSPNWLNKDLTSKKKDHDNNVKVLHDAFSEASHIPDEIIHHFHPFKMYAREEKCIVHVFEIENKIHTH